MPVDAKERLPENESKVNFVVYGSNSSIGTLHKDGFQKWGVTHWLEKDSGRIVHTVEQFKVAIAHAFNSGRNRQVCTDFPDIDQYIKSLLP